MTDVGGVRMYFGTGSGSARKALWKMEEPHIMISAQTKMNPWEGIDDLFVDSGGYSLMIERGEHPPAETYLDTVESYGATRFAVQDYPCEPDILETYGRTVKEHQRYTTERTRECIDLANRRDMDATPVAVVQGWEVEDYVRHVTELEDRNLLTEHVGIGSVCRRGQSQEIQNIIERVHEAAPDGTKLHAFGVKNDILSDSDTREYLHSADTTAWYFRNYDSMTQVNETWQDMVSLFLEYRSRLHDIATSEHDSQQLTMGDLQ